MSQYNQKEQKDTFYACTIYTMLNILKFDYWISVNIDNILWIVKYMEKLGALLPKWAYFSVIYPAMAKLLEWKTGMKFKIKVSSISAWLDNKHMWGLWFKKASKFYKELAKDQLIDKLDIDKIKAWPKGYWHNHAWKRKTILETLGGYYYEMSLKTLKYAVKQDIYYDTARTIVPWDARTERIQKELIRIAKKTGKTIPYDRFKYHTYK